MSGGAAPRALRAVAGAVVVVTILFIVACGGARVIEPEPPPPAAADPEESPAQAGDRGAGSESGFVLPQPGPGQVINPLTGYPVDAAALEHRVFLVSVDNHPRARPQYGLSRADLVYELPVEGGISRFAALFLAGEAGTIGPVRSSRHYFLDLALEWQAVWVHAGGSPQSNEQVDRLGIADVDDVRGTGGDVFWRGNDRERPHNLYTGSERVRARIETRGWDRKPPAREPWRFAVPDDLPEGEPAPAVEVRWPGSGDSAESFVYDEESGLYTRSVDGKTQVDKLTGEPLRVRNVLVQFVDVQPIRGDTEGRLDVRLVGSGRLLIFTAGTVREGRWRKVDRPSPTIFSEADGEPVTLVPGPTWVLIVPTRTEVLPGDDG